nr:hypothetical protein [Rhodococcus qingshengii]
MPEVKQTNSGKLGAHHCITAIEHAHAELDERAFNAPGYHRSNDAVVGSDHHRIAIAIAVSVGRERSAKSDDRREGEWFIRLPSAQDVRKKFTHERHLPQK